MNHPAGKLLSQAATLVLLSNMVVASPALAATATAGSSHAQHIREILAAKARQEARDKSKTFNANAVAAVKQVEHAERLLKSYRYEAALNELKSADRSLGAAIAVDPSLKLIPVLQDVRTYDEVTSPQAVTVEVNAVVEELKSGNVQGAKSRLNQLRSELITTYVFLPVGLYPAAIKEAVKEIEGWHYQQAETTIETAMNALVEEVEVNPLPVALANDAILDAEAIRTTDRGQALWDLDYAHEQMLTGERLGYFYEEPEAYKAAMQHIEHLRDAMGTAGEVNNLFTKAKESVNHLMGKLRARHAVAQGK